MKTAIQLGCGNIGRGFMGLLFFQSGYEVVFGDVVQWMVDKINTDKCYTVHVKDKECEDIKVENVRACISSSPEMIDEMAKADIITTAVTLGVFPKIAPTIAKGIERRMSDGSTAFMNVICCENGIRTTSMLKEMVYGNLSEEGKKYADEYIGFPDCAVDRIVPPIRIEGSVDVTVESYVEWDVERAGIKGEIDPAVKSMTIVDSLPAYLERKLFTLNTGHCVAAYLGVMKGVKTIGDAIADEKIYPIVRAAMKESGDGLIKKHGFDPEAHYKYIDKIFSRFTNPYLQDDVTRVGRDPLRKLSPKDRLIDPMMTAYGYGLPVDHLILGIGAALHYDNADDPQSVELQKLIAEKGIKGTITQLGEVTDEAILSRIEEAYNTVGSAI
ncbi:MAG: mannitol-1-phosphate 5-dehydrogenase [Eubacteriales bacterium]|nr:mannitol-1-phosphate 5-dehydrogenase [Eubacteriales bacterium]